MSKGTLSPRVYNHTFQRKVDPLPKCQEDSLSAQDDHTDMLSSLIKWTSTINIECNIWILLDKYYCLLSGLVRVNWSQRLNPL